MALTVNTNLFSLAAQRNVTRTQSGMMTAVQRLSSGLRVNMAKDDAAGLANAMVHESNARSAAMSQRATLDAISAEQVKDNAMRTVGDILQRARELVVGAGGTFSQMEISALGSQANAISTDFSFHGTVTAAELTSLMSDLGSVLAGIGATQSALEHKLNSEMATEEAAWASYGRIMDADFARETARMASAQVVMQAGVSALAQANTLPQMALGLLR